MTALQSTGHPPSLQGERGGGHIRLSVPRLGGYTRRGEGSVLPPARSRPALLGKGVVRTAAPNAQLLSGAGVGRIQRPISLRVSTAPDQDASAPRNKWLIMSLP
jgi:hypothetical protein